jgi:protein O-GlcNAc transferase
MSGHRLPLFARKPAPIQVTAWGEPTGTGLKTIDYLVSDPVLVPEQERALLAEKVLDLPNFLGFWTPDRLPEPGPLPALSRDYVTFGSFNRFAKMLDPVLRAWAQILRAVPRSRLLLKKDRQLDDAAQTVPILALLAEEGIAADRVTMLDQMSREDHFAAYRDMDIALDPFPHGGGMTTLDALWMGVPVVTWPGRIISSRLAAATLTALGLTDFIAADVEAYVALTAAKAKDLEALAALRANLRPNLAKSAIGDPAQYARAVEAAYRKMWRQWCASH